MVNSPNSAPLYGVYYLALSTSVKNKSEECVSMLNNYVVITLVRGSEEHVLFHRPERRLSSMVRHIRELENYGENGWSLRHIETKSREEWYNLKLDYMCKEYGDLSCEYYKLIEELRCSKTDARYKSISLCKEQLDIMHKRIYKIVDSMNIHDYMVNNEVGIQLHDIYYREHIFKGTIER